MKNEALLIEKEEPREGQSRGTRDCGVGWGALDAIHLRLCDSQRPSGIRAFMRVVWEKSWSLEVLPPEPHQEPMAVSLGLKHNKTKGKQREVLGQLAV